MYLEVESWPGVDLALTSMEKRRSKDLNKHITVVSATKGLTPPGYSEEEFELAGIFVPAGQEGHFLEQLKRYGDPTPKPPGSRRHENAYDRVSRIRLATLATLWTDDPGAFPKDPTIDTWWEVWLRRTDGKEIERFSAFADLNGILVGHRVFRFDQHVVLLTMCSANSLGGALFALGDLAELRGATELATFFTDLKPREQVEWIDDLLTRAQYVDASGPSVCLLDTGVNAGHPLIAPALHSDDLHTVDPSWQKTDHEGHGTAMAGVALFGDLARMLDSDGPLTIGHRLESVKILPPNGSNAPEMYSTVTAEAVSLPEIQAPLRRRVFSMQVTADAMGGRGQPTAWSSAIDALACGRIFDPTTSGLEYLDEDETPERRLFVISAGNVDPTTLTVDHLSVSEVSPVQDPAQAWNALTVGATTFKTKITDPSWSGWHPLAAPGDLSPWSTTSTTFSKTWPSKPDVVAEGGNIVTNVNGTVDFPCDDLSILTTDFEPFKRLLRTTWATSPATAAVAGIAADILAEHPDMWPETVRALVVHSASWTKAMRSHVEGTALKSQRAANLLSRYGYGVPSLEGALSSAASDVTLIIQDVIQPFKDGRIHEVHWHELPWPKDVLQTLDGGATVKVTLSYFVEPNPGRRGWKNRYRYQSHGLRFAMKTPTESIEEFKKRLNQKALDEEEDKPSTPSSNANWFLGSRARSRGSLHSDYLIGESAADIAERGLIAVFPVSGWWKDLKAVDRSKYGVQYALVVSIQTQDETVDIWTPIQNQIQIPVMIA